jgi:hypothetical protein
VFASNPEKLAQISWRVCRFIPVSQRELYAKKFGKSSPFSTGRRKIGSLVG